VGGGGEEEEKVKSVIGWGEVDIIKGKWSLGRWSG